MSNDCEAIVKFYKRKNEKRISQQRWLEFTDRLISSNYKIVIEHIKGADNMLADYLSRIIYEPESDTNVVNTFMQMIPWRPPDKKKYRQNKCRQNFIFSNNVDRTFYTNNLELMEKFRFGTQVLSSFPSSNLSFSIQQQVREKITKEQ